MLRPPAICMACSRLLPAPGPLGEQLIAFCDAYPKGIPDPISSGEFDHRKKFGGEKDGMLFDQAPGEFAEVMLEGWQEYHDLQEE